MKRLNKKGFTIIELVIVIAVIAILAAVMVPTFSSIVEKANKSADKQEAIAYYKEVYAIDWSDGVLDGYDNEQEIKIDDKALSSFNITYGKDTNNENKLTFTYAGDKYTYSTTDGQNWIESETNK